jgi:hypothetical protein
MIQTAGETLTRRSFHTGKLGSFRSSAKSNIEQRPIELRREFLEARTRFTPPADQRPVCPVA